MCIYCGTTKYRQIYKKHYGPIPMDSDGRRYEVHHIDGNKQNNDPLNLKAVSIQEHYNIHYSQGDWSAASRIAAKMKLSPEEISKLISKSNAERVANGTHNFLGPATNKRRLENGTHPFLDKESARNRENKKVKDGNHIFLGGEIQRNACLQKVKKGTHPFLNKEKASSRMALRLENGTSPSQIKKTCENCNLTISLPMYGRWHGNKCKEK